MPKAFRDALHAKGKTDIYYFDPADVVLVEDKTSALYDERVDRDYKESLVVNMMYVPGDGEVPQGVLEPAIGRRNPETGKIEIIDGRQRTKAAREANRRLKKQGAEPIRLPVWLRKSSDTRAMAILISTNEHRTEDAPLAKAKKAQRYIDLGRDESEVSALLGVSTSTVKNLLQLLDAPAAVKHAVDAGKISASDGYRLAREEPEAAKKKLGELLEHAPRAPGKKRSSNAKKARAIMGKPDTATNHSLKKIEDGVAEEIAAWVEATWSDGNWGGAPDEIPKRIRAREWRSAK